MASELEVKQAYPRAICIEAINYPGWYAVYDRDTSDPDRVLLAEARGGSPEAWDAAAHYIQDMKKFGGVELMDPVLRAMIDAGQDVYTGWRHDPQEVGRVVATMPHPRFASAAPDLAGTGAGKTVLLYKAFKEVNGGSYIPYVAQAIGDCFPAGTMVLGEKTRPIERVRIGDKVWTAEGNQTEVVSFREIQTTKPMVTIDAVGALPIRCTADHRFLVYRLARVNNKRITPNHYRRAINGTGAMASAVVEAYEGRTPEWVAAADLTDTDYLLTPIDFDEFRRPESPDQMFLGADGCFLAGYFLGNGHASGGTVELTLPMDLPSRDRLLCGFFSAGFDPKVEAYSDRKAERIRVHSRSLVDFFREAFYDGREKSFPGWAIGDRDFLEGLRAADGHGNEHSEKIDSTSKSVVYGVVASLAAMGQEANVNEVSRSEGTYPNAKPLYRVTWIEDRRRQEVWTDDRFICRPVRKVTVEQGLATVYDIGVADDHHSFLANGFAVHNCVSMGFGHGIDLLEAVQISLGKKAEAFHQTATEAVYGMARVDIGGEHDYQDGAVGAWAAKAVSTIGTVNRDVVGPYSGQRAKDWGAHGVPDSIKLKAGDHKVKTASLVATADDAHDALANGYPVPVCSDQGFTLQRDERGACRPRGSWSHCMLICGVRVNADGSREFCIFQSWGPQMPTGPLSDDQPPNSFWIDDRTMGSMLRMQDSFALSGFEGYPGQAIPDSWSYSDAA